MLSSPIFVLAGFVAATFLAALPGAGFRPGAWYEGLRKPGWRPPNAAFPIAWTMLYILIAVAGWLVWRERGFGAAAVPLSAWVISLLINSTWSSVMFGAHRIGLALLDLIALWLSIMAMIWLFAPVTPVAAWLLAPYLVWVSFAGVLNFEIWRLNR